MSESAYKQAGVDIDAGAELVNQIKPHIKKTNRSGVMSGLGGFGALFDLKATGYKDPILVSGTDGVGTKLKLAIDTNTHNTIGIDAVAMCVNDIIVQGAEPLFFLDYFATGKLENNVAENVIKGIAKGCELSGCALIGGETAEMPGMYGKGDYDIAGFSVGAVERENLITGEAVQSGDIILGLSSSGVHSNGFSLVRHILSNNNLNYSDAAPFAEDKTLGDVLLAPTRIYVKPLLESLKIKDDKTGKQAIRGMVHITGGGFLENIPRILPECAQAVIDCNSWELPDLFKWLAKAGNLNHYDLSTTFNCGIGMAVICAKEHADIVQKCLEDQGENVKRIGYITDMPSDAKTNIVMNNQDEAWSKDV